MCNGTSPRAAAAAAASSGANKGARRAFAFFTFGVVFPWVSLYLVQSSMDEEKRRRHMSIARDIERERWRRQQLGLPPDVDDDGFADKFEHDKRNAFDIDEAKRAIAETQRLMAGGVMIPDEPSVGDRIMNFISRRPT